MTTGRKSVARKKGHSWRNHNMGPQITLQTHSDKDSVYGPDSKQTINSEKQNVGPGNKPVQIQPINFSFLLLSKVKFLKERKISLF